MGLCGTCKHWGKKKDTGNLRMCHAIIHANDLEVGRFYTKELPGRAKAGVYDGEGYIGYLASHANFGCVLHKPREAS